jgi:cysteine desulfurase
VHKPIYFDNLATTPVDPRVVDAMLPYFGQIFGNAASRSHSFGWQAEQAVEQARRRVAGLAGATPREIVFTSGATEANNLALKGVCEAYGARGNHLITIATEHKSVLDPAHYLKGLGASVTVLQPRSDGLLDLEQLRQAIRAETILVSVLYANNEIGVIQPIAEIGAICRERRILFHTDAAQAFGKLPIRLDEQNIDIMSVSGHKVYGPKGIGALCIRRGVRLSAQIHGGGHERGMRSGTLNVPAIVGFGEACAICAREMGQEATRISALRDRLKARIESQLNSVFVNGSMEHRLPGNLNLSFAGANADALLLSLPEIALSTGSACSSATAEPSHVLRALGVSEELARSSVRFGLGRFNTEEEVDYVAGRLVESVRKLHELAPQVV